MRLTRPFSKGITSRPSQLDALAGRLGDEVAAAHRLGVGRGRGPFLDDQALADVEAAGREGDVGPGLEDRADVGAGLLAARRLARRVVVEDHVRRVHRHDRVEVVGVPGVVVAVDRLSSAPPRESFVVAHGSPSDRDGSVMVEPSDGRRLHDQAPRRVRVDGGLGRLDLAAGAQGARHLGLRLQPGRDRARRADPRARRGRAAARSSST